MRIAYVTETFPPEVNGVSLNAARAVRHLRGAGHAVQVVRPRQPGEEAVDDAAEWRCPGVPLPLVPDLRLGLARAAALRRRWQRYQPDLVHVATPGPLSWAALRAARAEGVATSADFRINLGSDGRFSRNPLCDPFIGGWLRRLHALSDCNFVPTPALASLLAARGFERLHVIGRGVDSLRFAPAWRDPALRATWGAGPHDRVLLHVGRLAAEKNVDLVFSTWRRLRQTQPMLKLVIVGDGPLRSRLQAQHRDAHFAGMRRGDDLSRHFASGDVFLFPGLNETFGNVTLEALSSALAVVAFDTAAATVHIRNGRNGLLAPLGDAPAFVAAARRAVAAAAPDGGLRAAARETALAADWGSTLRAFEHRLSTIVADTAGKRVRQAAALA